MKKQDYIKIHAKKYAEYCNKRDVLRAKLLNGQNLTSRQRNSTSVELSHLGMYIQQEGERLLFALGALRPEDARKEYSPTSIQSYQGIGDELASTKFDDGIL